MKEQSLNHILSVVDLIETCRILRPDNKACSYFSQAYETLTNIYQVIWKTSANSDFNKIRNYKQNTQKSFHLEINIPYVEQTLNKDTDVQNSLLDSVGDGEVGLIWENGIETCII